MAEESRALARTAAVLPVQFSPEHWQAMREMAKAFHAAGALPQHWNSPERIIIGLQAGAEMGIPPVQALSTLIIVNGKIAMEGVAMLNKLKKGGVKVEWIESTDKVCRVKLTRPDGEENTEEFTIEEAQKAGLIGKDNWKKYPKDMLRWKALSRNARFHCPDITYGLYTSEEAADFEGSRARWTESGVVVDVNSPGVEAIVAKIASAKDKGEYEALRSEIDEAGNQKGISHADRLAIREACKAKLAEFEGIEEKKPDAEEAVEVHTAETNLESTISALKHQPEESVPDVEPEPEKKEKVEITPVDLNRYMIDLSHGKSPEALQAYWNDRVAPAPLKENQRRSLRLVVKQRLEKIKQEKKLSSTKVSEEEVCFVIGQ